MWRGCTISCGERQGRALGEDEPQGPWQCRPCLSTGRHRGRSTAAKTSRRPRVPLSISSARSKSGRCGCRFLRSARRVEPTEPIGLGSEVAIRSNLPGEDEELFEVDRFIPGHQLSLVGAFSVRRRIDIRIEQKSRALEARRAGRLSHLRRRARRAASTGLRGAASSTSRSTTRSSTSRGCASSTRSPDAILRRLLALVDAIC